MQVVSVSNVQMVDACHIVPFSISNDDTIKNGISLSPTLHRAFDRGLISISEDYKVMVSPLVRDDSSTAALTYYNGHPIITPTYSAYLPSQDNLAWHRGEVFLGGTL
jgi:putative restriction endonuclease